MTAEEILGHLDESFEIIHHDPPHLYQLSGHFYPADTRLTAFRSTDDWALVFEIVGFGPAGGPAEGVRSAIYCYGNRLPDAARYETIPFELLDTSVPIDPRRFSILWNDRRYDFTPTETNYAEAGITFDPARSDPEAHQGAQIVRYLCERLNHPFFLAEEELRDLPAQDEAMALFLQTRAWRHPVLSQEEHPSQVSSFRILARALETGDLAEWNRQDAALFNTDWRVYDWEEKEEEEHRRGRESRQDEEWEALPPELRAHLAAEAEADATDPITHSPPSKVPPTDGSH